jgi:hypothetical protein
MHAATGGATKGGDVRKALLAAATVAGLFTVAIPAQATVRDHEHYSQSYSDDFDACGFSIHTEGLATGNARIRVGKRDLDTAFFGLDNYAYSETWTNTANGRTLSIWGDAIIRDVSATHVEGSIFRFTTVESGRPFNLADASGCRALAIASRGKQHARVAVAE